MRSVRSIVAVAMAGLACALGVASATVPVAANAAVHATVSSAVGSSHAKAPADADDIYCPYHSGHWTAWYGACVSYTDHSCTAGSEGNMTPPNYVSNACGNNLYLYTGTDQSGSHLCVALDSRTHHLATYESYRVIVGGC